MDWLNLHTSILDSAEFIGADPTRRATWLCLLRYCIGQENGGRVVGCTSWSDRRWQQLARVTKREVATPSDLWSWDGSDLVVWAYPVDREEEVIAKRETARVNGRKGGRPREKPSVNPDQTQTEPTLVISEKAEGEGEGERKDKSKGKGKYKEVGQNDPPAAVAASAVAMSDEDWIAYLSASPAYSGIDVSREHGKCAAWCQTNRKQLTRRRFLNWLNRCEKPMQGPGRVANGGFAGEVASVRPKGWGTELPLDGGNDGGTA